MYNVGLSQRRAEAIVAALVDPFGINPGTLQPVGMGESNCATRRTRRRASTAAFSSSMSARNSASAAPVSSSSANERAFRIATDPDPLAYGRRRVSTDPTLTEA